MIGVDSTFVIDFLNGDTHAIEQTQKIMLSDLVVTPITIFETLLGFYVRQRPISQQNAAREFLDSMSFLEITKDCAEEAAKLQAALVKTGRMAQPTDILIAATCKKHGAQKILTKDKVFTQLGLDVLKY